MASGMDGNKHFCTCGSVMNTNYDMVRPIGCLESYVFANAENALQKALRPHCPRGSSVRDENESCRDRIGYFPDI